MSGKLPEDIDARIEAIFCDDLEGHDGERLVRTLLCDVLDRERQETYSHLSGCTTVPECMRFVAARISRERTEAK